MPRGRARGYELQRETILARAAELFARHGYTATTMNQVAEACGVAKPTLYNRFVRWRAAGVWDRLLAAVSAACDGDIVMIDSSCVRVHQHGAAVKRGAPRPVMVAWAAPGAG